MVDFHTHILPDIDDGSSSVEESVRMIEMLSEQGVEKIVLTPHFYAYVSSPEQFVEKRDAAVKKLLRALNETSINVKIYLGGEILLFEELWRVDEIREFCVGGTDYIMVEMPFAKWDHTIVESVKNLSNRGLVPIIAHFERYLKYKGNAAKIRELVNNGAVLQMNCEYLNKFFSRGKAVRFIKKGKVFALGTDCHSVSGRCPNYSMARQILEKKLGKKLFQSFIENQSEFLSRTKPIYPAKKD